MKFNEDHDDEVTKPLTAKVPPVDLKPKPADRRHVITITPVIEEDEVEDDRFVTVYQPTTQPNENGWTGTITKMVPKDLETGVVDATLGNGVDKPKAYIFPMVPSAGSASDTSAQSTPSDSRSMCDTPLHSDPWHIPELRAAGPDWKDMTPGGKIRHVGLIVLKVSTLLGLLYFFICSLDLLSTAFRLLGSRAVGRFFSDNELLQNPVVGLMIGVLVTVLVQSSSTSTSIVVTMVASKIIQVRQAIPIVMGANIGTSVTNTIVSLMQSADRNEFRRAFAAATVHDMFNWLTVLCLLPLEVSTRYLEILTTWLVKSEDVQQDKSANKEFLNKLTKPFTKMIIQVDKKLLELIASGNDSDPSARLVITCCDNDNVCKPSCKNSLFGFLGFSDSTTGIILLIISIIVLCSCLIMLVKVLNSMLTGHIAKLIKRTMNREYRFPYSIISDYCAIFAGCILTILVQSSSIFTSTLTPLAGIGVISLEKIYPLTLGSNIGTTTTGILAALSADSSRIHDTLQLALCHLFFNISGILLFYPIPALRFPIPLARLLGDITANYRWFSILYLVSMFFLLPLIVFSLSTLGTLAMVCIGGPVAGTLAIVVLINLIQHYHSGWLPKWLENWHFLPLWMRSLEPMDRIITKMSQKFGCGTCCGTEVPVAIKHRGIEGSEKQLGPDSTAASQLNLFGTLYKSNSEAQFENLIYNQGRLGNLFHGFGNHHTIHGIYNNPAHANKKYHRKSMAPAYNRAYNNNNNDDTTYDPVAVQFNHHTVHNPYEVHRYYPSSPFNTPTHTPHRVPKVPNGDTTPASLQVIVTSQPNSPANKPETKPEAVTVTTKPSTEPNGEAKGPFETNL